MPGAESEDRRLDTQGPLTCLSIIWQSADALPSSMSSHDPEDQGSTEYLE